LNVFQFWKFYWPCPYKAGPIKFPYFADITEREDMGLKQAQRQGDDRVILWITLLPQ
jgi:hypothetical protein